MTRLILFLVLMIGSPYWALLRGNYGSRFGIALFVACVASSAFLIAIEDRDFPQHVAFLAPYMDNGLIRLFYVGSAMICFFRLAGAGIRRPGHGTNILPPPHPWSTGWFPFWQSQPALTDLIVIAFFLWQVNAGTFTHTNHHIAVGFTAVAAVAYLILSYVSQLNHGRLPFDAPMRQKKPPKPVPPYLTMLRRMPRSARDDLGSIFSRRHAALKQIINPPN